jgi:hypothetical protein
MRKNPLLMLIADLRKLTEVSITKARESRLWQRRHSTATKLVGSGAEKAI